MHFLTGDRCKGKEGKQALKAVEYSLILEIFPPEYNRKAAEGLSN